MNKKKIGSILLSIISIGIITALIYYVTINADRYRELLQISITSVILLLLISCITPIFNGMINTYMFRSLGAELSHREGFLLAATSTLANQLPISGGIITRSLYLKNKYDLSYTKNFSSMLALFFCTVVTYGILGLAILSYWRFLKHIAIANILFIAFGLMACSMIVFWIPLDRIKLPHFFLKRVEQALEGWILISKNPLLLVQILSLQTVTMLLLAARYWLAFHMLSQNVSVSQVILFASASVLTQLVSFVPGGLGVREAIVGGIATALGFDTGTSIVAISLDRLIATIAIVTVGWVSTILLGKEISKTGQKTGNETVI